MHKQSISHADLLSQMKAEDIERFWSKVDRSGGPNACWLWTAHLTCKGYGQFRVAGRKGKVMRAHRVAYVLAKGVIPDDLLVCHDCPDGDNPACCNPAHLFVGTNVDNKLDWIKKGKRRRTKKQIQADDEQRRQRVSATPYRNRKLTVKQVQSIREKYANGEMSQGAIARGFGISISTANSIVHRKTWRSIE